MNVPVSIPEQALSERGLCNRPANLLPLCVTPCHFYFFNKIPFNTASKTVSEADGSGASSV